jgi:dTDP-4-dehydrorhamnose reductase
LEGRQLNRENQPWREGDQTVRILVTGAGGQLGSDLVPLLEAAGHEVRGCTRSQLDVTNPAMCRQVMEAFRPEVVIHTAAYTAVDQAEGEPALAYKVNAAGAGHFAVAAEAVGARLCYISTDYVFDGMASRPYAETDPVNPQTVYGKSKLAGELAVQLLCSRYYIVRTSWLYGRSGDNFVAAILKLARQKRELNVVNDQIGSPTYTMDLSRWLLDLIRTDEYGIYHASNTGACSRYEFARAILAEAGIEVNVQPCTTEEYPRPAPRPKFSVLDHQAIRRKGLPELPHWRDSLRSFMQMMDTPDRNW